jgi:pimeloyl-ACP methyl ester carboxylesterase
LSDAALGWVRAVPPAGRAVQRLVSAAAFSNQPEPDWWLPALAANLSQPKAFEAYRSEGANLRDPPSTEGLTLPILVIHGDQDLLVPIEVGRELAARAPQAELLEVPGGSHMLVVTHADLVAERIATFSEPATAPAPAAPPPGGGPSGAGEPDDLVDDPGTALALSS